MDDMLMNLNDYIIQKGLEKTKIEIIKQKGKLSIKRGDKFLCHLLINYNFNNSFTAFFLS